MNRPSIFIAALLAALLLASCNYVDPSLTHRTKVYTDASVDLSDLLVSIKPKAKQKLPVRVLMYPFWVQQDIRDNLTLGKNIGRIFHANWAGEEIFPVFVLDNDLVYRSPEKSVATARELGADLVVVGFVPYIYAGNTLDDTALTLQVNIYETRTGQLIFSMAQSARVRYSPPEDWFVVDMMTRMPDSPLYAAIMAIADDMGAVVGAWAPPLDSDLGYAYTSKAIAAKLVDAPPMPETTYDMESDLPEALSQPGVSVNIRVEFDKDRAIIQPEYYPYLDELGRALQTPELAGKTLVLAGHTDADADATYNQELSEKRAEAVKRYLVQKFGIAPERLLTRGYGESRPLAPNDSPENMQKNRRVEVWLVK